MRFAGIVAIILGVASTAQGAIPLTVARTARPEAQGKFAVAGMDEYMPQLARTLEQLVHGDFERGLEFIDPSHKMKDTPQFGAFKQQFTTMCERWGAYHGCEPAAVKCVSPRLHRIQVMGCFDNTPVMFTFTLYKPKDTWRCVGFTWEALPVDTLLEKHGVVTDLARSR